jgi:hypothetical protein
LRRQRPGAAKWHMEPAKGKKSRALDVILE